MRKKIINQVSPQSTGSEKKWLDLDKLAVIEVSSEDKEFPIESALLSGKVSGWRASEPGVQIIRLVFDNPQSLRQISLRFEEMAVDRTQEYILRWSPDRGQSYREIVRQQWNFSPSGATCEDEDYQVELSAVTVLELTINPDITEKNAFASIKALRVA